MSGLVITGCATKGNWQSRPDAIVSVRGKLSCFNLNDVDDSDYGINWTYGSYVSEDRMIGYPHVFFKGRIDLEDGTRYICTTPDGCVVNLNDCTITQGTVEVYYKKEQ